ncbi:MAG: DUF4271 domain-containing protein [Tannerella sp.]|nr:DUF4271 domain-containing protein [Tannerella sp.]
MNATMWDGFAGIPLDSGQLVYDGILVVILLLLTCFAFVFRSHYALLAKQFNSLVSSKERQSIFDTTVRENFFFRLFLKFQTLLLVSMFLVVIYIRKWDVYGSNIRAVGLLVLLFLGLIYVYYLIKQGMYHVYGLVFGEREKVQLWNNNYKMLVYLWGILVYFPILWLTLVNKHFMMAFILFCAIYIIFRLSFVYITVRIFYNKKNGILYLSSYLCAQEIVPLLCLYEGFNYLRNFIETSTLWQ